jgi:hypothetical protein
MRPYKIDYFAPVIQSFYEEETDAFFNSCHKHGGDKAACIQDTINSMSENAEFYIVEVGIETAAYFVKTEFRGRLVLEGFHVKPHYRHPLFFEEFWPMVERVMGDMFFIGLYEGNQRAILHLLKNGFERIGQITVEGKDFTLLVNRNNLKTENTLCHLPQQQ